MTKKKSVRFTSEKSAQNFAEETGGEFRDLREYEQRKSDFKVVIDKSKHVDDSYDRWYEEASMDGSLAYNGSADDF